MIALPVCAQRGGFHGASSGHAATASRGGFASSASARSSGYRGYAVNRSPVVARSFQRGVAGNYGARSPYTGSWRYRRPYVSPYRVGFRYGFPGYGWVAPYFLGYPDDLGYDDSGVAQGNAPNGYDAEPPDQQQPAPLPPYLPNADMSRPAQPPASEDAVTLIFKDGRPAQQIHNYILTPSTLYVGGQHQQAIPTDQLDLAATARVNRDAGVDFQIPNALR